MNKESLTLPTMAFYPYTYEDIVNVYKILDELGKMYGEDFSDITLSSAADVDTVLESAKGLLGLPKGSRDL